MSAWRMAVRALHDLGGSATARDIWLKARLGGGVYSGLTQATKLGLVTGPGRGAIATPYTLTQRGIDWAENRLTLAPGVSTAGGRPPMRMVCTWLSALPRGIRLGAPT